MRKTYIYRDCALQALQVYHVPLHIVIGTFYHPIFQSVYISVNEFSQHPWIGTLDRIVWVVMFCVIYFNNSTGFLFITCINWNFDAVFYWTYPVLYHKYENMAIFRSGNLYSLCSPGNQHNHKIIYFWIFSSKIGDRSSIIKYIYSWLYHDSLIITPNKNIIFALSISTFLIKNE